MFLTSRVSALGTDFPVLYFQILRQAGQAWQRLTDEQKIPYLEKQHAQQAEYDKAMEIYRLGPSLLLKM